MRAQHQSAKLRELGEGKGKMGPGTINLLGETEFTLTCVLWERQSVKFTEQDDRIPSNWAVKTPGVPPASPMRLYPESGSATWSLGAEPAGSMGGDFLAACICVSHRLQEGIWVNKSILLAACLSPFPSV